MEPTPLRRPTSYRLLGAALVATVSIAYGYKLVRARDLKEGAANYVLTYPGTPQGFNEIQHSPELLFMYQDNATKVLLGGGVNQVITEFNPTPELQTDELAKQVVDTTLANMPGWKAETLGTIPAKNIDFRLVRRSQKDHVVYTAFAVKGNTTIMLTFTGRNKHVVDVENKIGIFKDFVSQTSVNQADLSKL